MSFIFFNPCILEGLFINLLEDWQVIFNSYRVEKEVDSSVIGSLVPFIFHLIA